MKNSMHKAQAYDLKRETKTKRRKHGFFKVIEWKHKINIKSFRFIKTEVFHNDNSKMQHDIKFFFLLIVGHPTIELYTM